MKWEKIETYRCPCCGYVLNNREMAEYILNCPKCGEKAEKDDKLKAAAEEV